MDMQNNRIIYINGNISNYVHTNIDWAKNRSELSKIIAARKKKNKQINWNYNMLKFRY